jgi:ABC-2 type transport system permease protein
VRVVRRALAQSMKELFQFRRDPLTMALAYLLPFAALLMYGFATRLEAKDIPVAIINYDSGKLSRNYVDSICASQQFIVLPWSGRHAMEPLDDSTAKAVIIIPPEFSRKLKSGLKASVQLLIDGTDVNNARIIKNGFIGLTESFLAQEGLPHKRLAVAPHIRLWFNPGRKEAIHIVPGAIALVIWIFPALLSAFAMVREKEQGTILQLYASSISSFELILGKAIAYFLIGTVEAVIVIVGAIVVFGLPFVGNPVAFTIYTLLYVSSGIVFGLWAGTRASNQMAAVQICAMIGFLGSMLLSGFIYPIRNITYPISLLSNVVPARYYIEATRDAFVRGGDWTAHWYVPVFLFVLTAFFLLVGAAGMRKMQLSR